MIVIQRVPGADLTCSGALVAVAVGVDAGRLTVLSTGRDQPAWALVEAVAEIRRVPAR